MSYVGIMMTLYKKYLSKTNNGCVKKSTNIKTSWNVNCQSEDFFQLGSALKIRSRYKHTMIDNDLDIS